MYIILPCISWYSIYNIKPSLLIFSTPFPPVIAKCLVFTYASSTLKLLKTFFPFSYTKSILLSTVALSINLIAGVSSTNFFKSFSVTSSIIFLPLLVKSFYSFFILLIVFIGCEINLEIPAINAISFSSGNVSI